MVIHDDLIRNVNYDVLVESSPEHLLRDPDYYPFSDENETFSPAIYFEIHACVVINVNKIYEQRATREQYEAQE